MTAEKHSQADWNTGDQNSPVGGSALGKSSFRPCLWFHYSYHPKGHPKNPGFLSMLIYSPVGTVRVKACTQLLAHGTSNNSQSQVGHPKLRKRCSKQLAWMNTAGHAEDFATQLMRNIFVSGWGIFKTVYL